MADGANECFEEMEFHQCATPRGMNYFDLEALPMTAQQKLNQLKHDTVHDNLAYLALHPEVECLITMLLTAIFKEHPRRDLPQFAAKVFSRPKFELEEELIQQLRLKDKNNVTNYRRPSDHFDITSEVFHLDRSPSMLTIHDVNLHNIA